jgi:hypothetical protein
MREPTEKNMAGLDRECKEIISNLRGRRRVKEKKKDETVPDLPLHGRCVLSELVEGQNGPKKSVDENFGRNLSSFIIRYRYREELTNIDSTEAAAHYQWQHHLSLRQQSVDNLSIIY